MTDFRPKVDEISSPCVRNCCLNEHDYCLGCYRHLQEILTWHDYSEPERLAIMTECRELKLDRCKTEEN